MSLISKMLFASISTFETPPLQAPGLRVILASGTEHEVQVRHDAGAIAVLRFMDRPGMHVLRPHEDRADIGGQVLTALG